MAFFDFDSKLQKLLILGALASMTALPCGCREEDHPTMYDDFVDSYHDPYLDPIEDVASEEASADLPEDAEEPDLEGEDALDVTGDADGSDPDEDDALEDAEDVDGEDVAADEEDVPVGSDGDVAALVSGGNHGFVRGKILATAAGREGIQLRLLTPALPRSHVSFSWSSSSGKVIADGDRALWYLADMPGVHAVQAVAQCDGMICLEVYRIRVPG